MGLRTLSTDSTARHSVPRPECARRITGMLLVCRTTQICKSFSGLAGRSLPRHPQGPSQAGPRAPPGCQHRLPLRRRAVQGDPADLRHLVRPAEAAGLRRETEQGIRHELRAAGSSDSGGQSSQAGAEDAAATREVSDVLRSLANLSRQGKATELSYKLRARELMRRP